MKSKRQQAIINIIDEFDIETQDDLITHLRSVGFDVTQATVSRDIRDLQITKSQNSAGKYTYSLPLDTFGKSSTIYGTTMMQSLRTVTRAKNIVVIKTYPGLAQAVAAGIDSQKANGVLGCVAGDDTIIIVTKDDECAEEFTVNIKEAAGLEI